MAEGIAKTLTSEDQVISRGLMVYDQTGANPFAIAVMTGMGIDISGHIARPFDINEVTDDTMILTMTVNHRDYLLDTYKHLAGKVETLLAYAGMGTDIHDPYGLDISAYHQCAGLMKEALMKVLSR